MAAYLAGAAPLPRATPRELLWITAARAETVSGPGLGGLTAQECAVGLGATPAASLLATARTGLGVAELVPTLVRSGLAAHAFRRVDDPDAVARTWARVPLAALLLTSPLLPYRSGSPDWDRAELEPEEALLLDEVGRRCADFALQVLAGRRPRPGLGTQPVDPLRPDAALREPRDRPGDDLSEYHEQLRAYARSSRYAELFAPVEQRASVRSALSLGFALLARIAAQGDAGAAEQERRIRQAWVRIAVQEPDLAAADLALAEFLASGWFAHHA